MEGMAKKLFMERKGYSPFDESKNNFSQPNWPLLNKLRNSGILPYIDYILAERLTSSLNTQSESMAAFICHLSICTKQGHLCIQIDENGICPDPYLLWRHSGLKLEEANTEVNHNTFIQLSTLIMEGAQFFSPKLITKVSSDLSQKVPLNPICSFGNLFYFQRNWVYETYFLKALQRILHCSPCIKLDEKRVDAFIEKLVNQGQLFSEQAKAIKISCKNSFSMICGGPGTGKTYTAGLFFKVFLESIDNSAHKKCEIVLAAPTGKAAANLQSSLNKYPFALHNVKSLKAQTIHSLLGINGFRSTSLKTLTADLIIIDESSMIDVCMMAQLFSCIKPGARLILLGDKHQLPPVEAGNLFSDLNECLSETEYVVELKKCVRTELQAIIDFADAIKRGNSEKACIMLPLLSSENTIPKSLFENEKNNLLLIKERLIAYALQFFPSSLLVNQNPQELYNLFNKFRILSPLRQGSLGVEALNFYFLQILAKKMRKDQWFVAPIMISTNDHTRDLSNGEVGLLIRRWNTYQNDHFLEGDYALFPGRDSPATGSLRRVPALLLPKFEYAYCLSVHKSQGSEFEHVLLLLPEGSEVFGREVLYTGATRARKRLEIWGNEQILKQTIDNTSHRLSGTQKRLEKMVAGLKVNMNKLSCFSL
jgi:exodeoxyribonuclease V alpha subunit